MIKQLFIKPDWRRIHADLPIFRFDDKNDSIIYTPGHILRVNLNMAASIEAAVNNNKDEIFSSTIVNQIISLARQAETKWQGLVNGSFEPDCLTIYLTNSCNLQCTYCYSRPEGMDSTARVQFTDSDTLTLKRISEYLEIIVSNCAKKGSPLTVVFHGGGEPTMAWSRLQKTAEFVQQTALENDLPKLLYIATHGIISAEKARWIGKNFDIVGLSCDGMPQVQQNQRVTPGKHGSNSQIERTSRLVREAGARLHVRMTVMPESSARQYQMVDYVLKALQPDEIRLEAAYKLGSKDGFCRDDAPEFLEHFLKAKQLADQHNVELMLSGVRHDEIHGPYCSVLKNSLQVLADGSASNCFLSWQADENNIGSAASPLYLYQSQIHDARQQVGILPKKCQQCPNIYHCARDCPDRCVLCDQDQEEVGFRCALQQLLTARLFSDS